MNDTAELKLILHTREEAHEIAQKLQAWIDEHYPHRDFRASVTDLWGTHVHFRPKLHCTSLPHAKERWQD